LVKYLKKKNVFEKFVKYADEHGVKKNAKNLKVSSELIQTDLEAYIVRNFFDNAGFYPIINSVDNTVQKAVELWNDNK
jgi:carboxyl-terminal processing protease